MKTLAEALEDARSHFVDHGSFGIWPYEPPSQYASRRWAYALRDPESGVWEIAKGGFPDEVAAVAAAHAALRAT